MISPVIPTVSLTGWPRSRLTSAVVIVTPADGPSLGTAPAGTWTWTRRRGGITVRTSFQTLLDYDVARQVCWEVMRFDITEKGRTRSVVQKHPTRIVFPQELRALGEMAGGWELCGWFSNFSLARPLERARNALMMITVLRRV